MRYPSFTPQEIKALIFLLVVLIIGGGITLYKRSHPHFAPELISDFTEQKDMSPIQKESFQSKKPKIRDKIRINQAPAKELELLPGIGPVLAERIISLRESKGKFKKVDELLEVNGIGSKKLEEIKEWIVID
jgi:comEA protein